MTLLMIDLTVEEVLANVGDIFRAAGSDTSLLWQLAPIVLVWLTLEFYFGFYGHESLGWNTALANGISLFWIVISALQYIFSNGADQFSWVALLVIGLMALYGLLIIITTFKHSLSEKVEFALASTTPIYYFSAIVLLVAYQKISLSLPMIVAIFSLFLFFVIFFIVFRKIIPNKDLDEKYAKTKDDVTSDSDDADFSSDKDSFPSSEEDSSGFDQQPSSDSGSSLDDAVLSGTSDPSGPSDRGSGGYTAKDDFNGFGK